MATARNKASAEKIILVPLTDLYERPDHSIKMRNDTSIKETINSVKRSGILTPAIVRLTVVGRRVSSAFYGDSHSGYCSPYSLFHDYTIAAYIAAFVFKFLLPLWYNDNKAVIIQPDSQ